MLETLAFSPECLPDRVAGNALPAIACRLPADRVAGKDGPSQTWFFANCLPIACIACLTCAPLWGTQVSRQCGGNAYSRIETGITAQKD